MDRRTFYRNFDSKNDVLEHYIEDIGNQYMREFNNTNVNDRYAATLLFFEFWKPYIPFTVNIQNCGLSNFVFTRFEKFVKSNKALLIDSKEKNIRMDYIFTYRIGGFWNVMLTWAAHDGDIPPAELATILCNA